MPSSVISPGARLRGVCARGSSMQQVEAAGTGTPAASSEAATKFSASKLRLTQRGAAPLRINSSPRCELS